MSHQIFVYGTLRDDDVVSSVLRESIANVTMIENVVLKGFKKHGLNILEDESSWVPGRILVVNDEQLTRLDWYESLGSLYKRIKVNVDKSGESESTSVEAYQLI